VASVEILDEYFRVADELANGRPDLDIEQILAVVTANIELVEPVDLDDRVCDDPDDDKFFACALAASADFIVSGDRHLLNASGYRGVRVLRPRQLVDRLGG
jgi:putative PIN family toxin of toxin-antitoxin system